MLAKELFESVKDAFFFFNSFLYVHFLVLLLLLVYCNIFVVDFSGAVYDFYLFPLLKCIFFLLKKLSVFYLQQFVLLKTKTNSQKAWLNLNVFIALWVKIFQRFTYIYLLIFEVFFNNFFLLQTYFLFVVFVYYFNFFFKFNIFFLIIEKIIVFFI